MDEKMKRKYGTSVFILGPTACGKTSLLKRFKGKEFSEEYYPSEYLQRDVCLVPLEGRSAPVRLTMMDADGRRQYEGHSVNYYRVASAFIVVYDISDQTSMIELKDTCKEIKDYNENPCCILVGNKCDKERAINKEDAEDFAQSNDMLYIETSAKTNTNVDEMFKLIVKRLDETKGIPDPPTKTKETAQNTAAKSEPVVTTQENSNCNCTIC